MEEGATTNLYEGAKAHYYSERRGSYERINGTGWRSRRRRSRVKSGAADGCSPRRRLWRIKLTPMLKLKLKLPRFSLKKLLIKLRDGYVNMMMKFANSRYGSSRVGAYAGDGLVGFGVRPRKEYDEKMIIEIYRSLVLAQGMVPLPAPKLSSRHPHLISAALTN